MSFNHFNRRLHLYLGLLLLPWILMYAASSFVFNHNRYFQSFYDDGVPRWSTRLEQTYDREISEGEEATILADFELDGGFSVRQSNPQRIQLMLSDFWSMTRVTYEISKQEVRVEDRRFQWNQCLTWMHERSGYHHDSLLHDAWAITVDLTCAGFLLFIASGLYMWLGLRNTRKWGALALVGGMVSFIALVVAL